ncbi:hydantoinase/oxoprolinase family protein [Microvirga antarctica]|uniref:hydantoinase/oxoprolinase family protein n=1 Tax=Microvirga antarctica TaxID=2819233 RepID=UPI001B30A8B5|nr:hydantoinase/oxoprolinase family protein [Microvirga antarctica]
MFRIGVDIGGTFTDFAIWRDESDGYVQIGSHKLPTSRPDFSRSVIDGISALVARHAVRPNDPVLIVHGTTVSTNAVIERSQPPIALLTTEGYRDLLSIARLRLDKPIDLFNRRPAPIVPRERVFEVRERLTADGAVDTPIDDASVIAGVQAALDKGASAVAICFLHAFRNPVHERRAVEVARRHFPGLTVMASHEVWPQQSEYERATLTLLNLYVKPLMEGYIGRIDAYLAETLPQARLYITKSNGGIMSSAEARELPIHTLLSGPAAGVTAAQTLGGYLGLDRILTLDMGGTSTDVSLIDNGRPVTSGQAEVGDFPLLMPVTAIEAMGAGGGSIIWLDDGLLKVGPRSAGSQPGPACYGQGGLEPTLTDAYLVLNYLSPDGLLGGTLRLDRALAEKALAPIAAALKTDVIGAAESAVAVATSTMLAKVLPFLARMGVGTTDLSLMIYGGAGGVHGPLLADEMGIRHIVVPRLPSVFCAFGGLVSDLVHDAVRSLRGATPTQSALVLHYEQLRQQGDHWLERQSDDRQVIGTDRLYLAEMRYAAQSFTIPVDLTEAIQDRASLARIVSLFHDEHERLFGHADRSAEVVIDDLRLRTSGRQAKPQAIAAPAAAADRAMNLASRSVRFAGQWREDTPVFAWRTLNVGWSCAGPAIVQQDLATVLVPPGYTARIGLFGDLEMMKD